VGKERVSARSRAVGENGARSWGLIQATS